MEILERIAGGPANAREVAAAEDEQLPKVAYHMNVLRRMGCIRPVEPLLDDASDQVYELASLTSFAPPLPISRSTRSHAIASVLQRIVEKGSAALEAGMLADREGSIVTCESVLLDEQGRQEAKTIMHEAAKRIEAAKSATAKRLATSGGEAIQATIAFAAFETPK